MEAETQGNPDLIHISYPSFLISYLIGFEQFVGAQGWMLTEIQ